jgi:NTP pyrophosphatase (non-canonical NTP hydrolase)
MMTDSNKIYYIYHIPNKKIGVTTDPRLRVEKQQGYKSGQYEILLVTNDIDEVSVKEIELQKRYGYTVDRKLYKNLNNKKMKINSTEQTSTFPVSVNDLEDFLAENKGLTWTTHLGEFKITNETGRWILNNIFRSQYGNDKCYIYNKAYYEAFIQGTEMDQFNDEKNLIGGLTMPKQKTDTLKPITPSMRDIFPLIRQWAEDRGIYEKGDEKTQYIKLMEEAGELAQALLKQNQKEAVDAIGDMVVVLTNLAVFIGVDIEDCIGYAYNEIKNRKGSMSNGTFVKQL